MFHYVRQLLSGDKEVVDSEFICENKGMREVSEPRQWSFRWTNPKRGSETNLVLAAGPEKCAGEVMQQLYSEDFWYLKPQMYLFEGFK